MLGFMKTIYPNLRANILLCFRKTMTDFDQEKFLNEPIYAFDFRFMIGDVEDFLVFSEANIEWQYRRELLEIKRRAETEDFEPGFRDHLETNAEHRFTVSLPLRVRYGVLVAFTTSVEWAVGYIVGRLKEQLSQVPNGTNQTVHYLLDLNKLTGLGDAELLQDYEALVNVRNCIVHSSGLVENYKFREELPTAISRLKGVHLGNWHFFGEHVCIERSALNPYIRGIADYIVKLYEACDKQGLWESET